MQPIRKEFICQVLKALDIQPGDGLLVHSALQYLGKPENGVDTYFEAIRECIVLNSHPGELDPVQGTLAVPTFNFSFARGEPYDPQTTPSQGMGVFSEYVRQRPEALRTPHPMQSLAVIGKYAEDLSTRDTPSAFDPGSAFERMLELNFKLLLLGADIQAVSMLHYSEQRAGVPYRYWKDFTAPYHAPGGWEVRTYRMFVRDLVINARLSLFPVQAELESRGLWHAIAVNYGKISTCKLQDFVDVVDEFLRKDPWSLQKRDT